MYGLPANFDAEVFVGKKLDLICYSTNTINISFEGDVSITLMGSFIYRHSPYETVIKQCPPMSSSDMMRLVGKVVCYAEGRKDGTLTLRFDNGHILELLDDVKEYEAYIIRIGKRDIIV